jgi:hypothetical protein
LPRDVVEIHLAAMRARAEEAPPQKTQAYVEEGRVLVLELMGHLANFYRLSLNRMKATLDATQDQ